MAKPRLVRVIWYDAVTEAGWYDGDPKKLKCPRCETIGWLLAERKDALVVAGSKAGSDYGDVSAIPMDWRIKIEDV